MTAVCLASLAVPAVAAGALAAAVLAPVLVHLLSRQRVVVVEWAAVRFLVSAQKQSRRRVDRWVLLAARVLSLVVPLVGLCAATPWAERAWQLVRPGAPEVVSNAPRTHRIIVLDNSLSMSARAGERTRFEAAAALAERAVTAAAAGDAFTLVTAGAAAVAVVPGPAADPDKVVAELRAVAPTHAAGDLAGALSLAADAVGRSPRSFPRKQVVIVTDLQRSAWAGVLPKPGGAVPELWARLTAKADVLVLDAAGNDADNLAVTDLVLADPLPLSNAPAAVTAVVQNFGRTDARPVRVELLLGRPSGGGPEPVLFPVEQRVIDVVPAGERVTVAFALDGAARFRDPGLHLVQVRLVQADDLTVDDVRTLAVDVRDGVPTVVVDAPAPASAGGRRARPYLLDALAPGGKVLPGNPVRPRGLSPAEFADPGLGDLAGVDCVFLADVPALAPAALARLDAHLKRGGGVVVGLGPNAAANPALTNRALFNNGDGLLPGPVGPVKAAPGGYRLFAPDASFRRPPLAAFRDDNARAGLSLVPVAKYLTLDAPADGRARRIMSFTPEGPPPGADAPKTPPPAAPAGPADPAVVEFPRFRGKVLVVTTSLNGGDWTDWPVLPTFLPFMHELARHAAAGADRRSVRVGEVLEEFVPVNQVGLDATVTRPDGASETIAVVAGDEAGVVRFADTALAGVYRVAVGGKRVVFAVNVPDAAPGGGSESDLRRVTAADLAPLGPKVTLAADPADTAQPAEDGTSVVVGPRPHGPTLARWGLALALALIAVELLLAWRLGPGRARGLAAPGPPARFRALTVTLGLVPLVIAAGLLAVVAHERVTGELFGFAPDAARARLEALVGVPPAAAGEGTRWRLETSPAFLRSARADARLGAGLFAVGTILTLLLYRLERRAAGGLRRVILPALLRLAALAVACFVMLPQLRLAVDREGWPDVAILLDASASMATVDDLQDPAVRAKAEQLAGAAGLSSADRLALAKQLVTRGTPDLLERLLVERRVKVHVYAVSDRPRLVADVSGPDDLAAGRAAVAALAPDGDSSRLGDAVQGVLKQFRGGSLAAVIAFTDGVVTAGDDLPRAGREAARAGVPLYLVGLGDSREPLDLAVGDVRADDAVLKGDTLVIEARVTARGTAPGARGAVVLSERLGDKLVERARDTVALDPSGKPVPIRLSATPAELGEKTFVVEVAALPGEAEAGNNRAERIVLVTESRKLRVLYLDGYPRYEFRFLKSLLEREAPQSGQKSVELSTILVDASPGYAEQDKSALRGLPTKAELFGYDVVVLGDVDPVAAQFGTFFQDLSEFVTQRGGGLLVIAGQQNTPAKYFTTPLAAVLPVAASDAAPAAEVAITEGYRPQLTPYGRTHPLFRLAADDAESARAWAGLKPLFWAATGYKRKASAEVLATHPDRPGEGAGGELHPLVVQQFAGAGRVLFFGFDETWRWRFRQSEDKYNQFWTQAVRVLAKARVTRPELRTDKQTAYRRGEPIRLTVRFPDDAPAPPADAAVKVRADRTPPGGGGVDSRTVQLAKVDGSRATYQTLLTSTPDGEYRFELTDPAPAPVPGSPPGTPLPARARAEARVQPPPGERDRLDMDRPALERAAAESRGKFYTLATAADLVDDLPDGARVPLDQPVAPTPVWNHAAVFALFAALLAAEWVLRRRERLL